MQFFGYIEGFYGKLLSHKSRKTIIDSLAESGLNSYIYAPKEDIFHRVKWREEPPKEYLEELGNLIEYGRSKSIDVTIAIAPGLSFNYSLEDEEILFSRLAQFIELGVKRFALFMDDVPLELPTTVEIKSRGLGELHGKLLTKINQKFSIETLFCPTLYTDELLSSGSESEKYTADLFNSAPTSTKILWTGNRVISETINAKSCSYITKYFGDRIIIWDNLYANDYSPSRLFVGPYSGRDREFINSIGGVLINGTGLVITDTLLTSIFGEWVKLGDSTYESWKGVAKKFGIPQQFNLYLPWFSSPFSSPPLETLESSLIEPIEFFNSIIVNWQSPLKVEWYPMVHRFFVELRLAKGETGDREWFQQRFYPHTANRLESSFNDSQKFTI